MSLGPPYLHRQDIAILLQLISAAFEHSMLHVWEIYALEMQYCTLQSMGRTNHKFPVHAALNVLIHLKSIIAT